MKLLHVNKCLCNCACPHFTEQLKLCEDLNFNSWTCKRISSQNNEPSGLQNTLVSVKAKTNPKLQLPRGNETVKCWNCNASMNIWQHNNHHCFPAQGMFWNMSAYAKREQSQGNRTSSITFFSLLKHYPFCRTSGLCRAVSTWNNYVLKRNMYISMGNCFI